MLDRDMITVRNKKTGEQRTIPRAQFNNGEEPDATTGLAGIGNDISNSLSTAPDALGEMITSIPGGLKKFGNYAASNNPVETLANIGAGGVESGTALLSSPQVLMRYLAQKFPKFGQAMQRAAMPGSKGINDPTLYESLMNFEKEHGLGALSPEEATVRSGGGLLFGGGLLKNLPGMLSRTAAIASEQAGRGGDPVHAAILAMIGDKTGQVLSKGINKAAGEVQAANVPPAGTPPSPPGSPVLTANMASAPSIPSAYTTISNIPKAAYNIAAATPRAVKNTISAIPEVAGKTAASALETSADLASEIPVVGKAISPIVQPTMGALASYLKHISVSPEELAKRNLFGDIEASDLPAMEKMNDAAKRLGITYATPSELLDSPFESVKQANVGRTTKGMKLLYKLGKDREASEGTAINKLFDLIHEDNLDPVKKAAYDETMQNSVPDDFIARQTARPVIKKAMKSVDNNTAYKQMLQEEYGVDPANVAKNSFMYWDMVKRVLGDMEKKLGRKGADTEASVYGNTRRSMVSAMDAIEPQYKVARNIAERKFTREELENVFDKKDKTFNNFDSYLKSKEKLDKIMKKLEPFPEAKQQLEDIKLFSGNMIPNNPTVRAAAALKRTGMSDARNAIEAKKREFDEKYGQEHDVAAVKLMTNPDLMALLKQHLTK